MARLLGRGRSLLRVASVLAVTATLATTSIALGTPPSGTVTPNTLADVKTANIASMDVNEIHLETQAPIRVLHVSNVALPGYSSGWHQHTGPVIIAVTKGSLTFYDRAKSEGEGERDEGCKVTTVSAPGGYIETAGKPIQVYNTTLADVNGGKAEWITTQLIPPGALTRVDVKPGFCGV
jgi:hypothetical protein